MLDSQKHLHHKIVQHVQNVKIYGFTVFFFLLIRMCWKSRLWCWLNCNSCSAYFLAGTGFFSFTSYLTSVLINNNLNFPHEERNLLIQRDLRNSWTRKILNIALQRNCNIWAISYSKAKIWKWPFSIWLSFRMLARFAQFLFSWNVLSSLTLTYILLFAETGASEALMAAFELIIFLSWGRGLINLEANCLGMTGGMLTGT